MTGNTPIVGCILAGGLSRRMGGVEKAFLSLSNKPLVLHAIERLQKQSDVQIINANGDAARFSQFGHPVAKDRIEGFAGPLAGVHAALSFVRENVPGASAIVTAACDTPFFPADLVSRLRQNQPTPETIVLARSGEIMQPVFGLWPVSILEDLQDWLQNPENRKVMAFVKKHPNRSVDFAPAQDQDTETETETHEDPFFNVNRPEDLRQAEQNLKNLGAR